MIYDPSTLWIFIVYTSLVLTGILLISWLLRPAAGAFGYWAAGLGFISAGTGAFIIREHVADWVVGEATAAATLFGASLIWIGFRRFDYRPARLWVAILPPLIWVAALQLSLFESSAAWRSMLHAALMAAITLCCAREVWRGRGERLFARWIAMAVLLFHAAAVAARIPAAYVNRNDTAFDPLTDARIFWFNFEWIAFLMVTTFIMVALVRERAEQFYRHASQVDVLTGLLNRRGFLEQAVSACPPSAVVAMLMLDLDRFKQVNDRFGHAAGDRVISLCARILRVHLRLEDVIGRMGGEEFAVLMPGVDGAEARLAAERVRSAFRAAADELELAGYVGTVSIGVATARVASERAGLFGRSPTAAHGEQFLLRLLAQADTALYRAKSRGRNRVEMAETDFEPVAARG